MPISSREVIRMIVADGWRLDRIKGDHHHFRHPERPGTATVPHPVKDLPLPILRSIERQSGVRLRKQKQQRRR